MCLTTTATKEVRKQVTAIVGLNNPKVFAVSPSKANILYVIKSEDDILEAFTPLLGKLKDPAFRFSQHNYILSSIN